MLETLYKPPTIDWQTMLPVFIVMGTGIVALIIEMLRPKHNNNAIVAASLIGLTVAGYFVCQQFGSDQIETFGATVVRDQFGLAIQLLLIISTGIAILFSDGYLREKRISFGEFYPLVLWSISGAMIMASTKNLLMIFLGIEVLSIALYVLAGLSRKETKSEESALKYFLLGAFASAFLLYGIAFVYGATGTLHLDTIANGLATSQGTDGLLIFGLGLILIGLGFKAAFVPFHQWTPDVYQGAPTNVTAFMAAGSKIAAIAVLYRVLDAFGGFQAFWLPALFWIAIATMTVGNLVALVQRDVKRILAYSSIAHAGYLLVAILAHAKAPDKVGFTTTVYYLLAYSFMTIGAFAVVSITARKGQEGTRLTDLNGLYRKSPLLGAAMLIFMASLIGIPPAAGFFGKWQIFQDAVAADLVALAIVLAVNSVISIAYYLSIVKAVLIDEGEGDGPPIGKVNGGLRAATIICLAGVIVAGMLLDPISKFLGGESGGIKEPPIIRTEQPSPVALSGIRL
ncbi:MAG: NADH-quinone oxidoreductase subunit N [Fimbriimonadaceae bacterium]|nr:NADH-quinone oxidoreductase subunit N [Fimbriimonadaceae bacterium]